MNSRPLTWLRHTLRNRLRATTAGRLLQAGGARPVRQVRVVCANRLTEKAFWSSSALGRSLAAWRRDHRVVVDLAPENSRGLPQVYNEAFERAGPQDAVLFVHDDVWLSDPQWLDKLLVALRRYDIVGLAGNRRRVRGQQFWLFAHPVGPTNTFDVPHISGAVGHGPEPRQSQLVLYGPMPATCELLDGLFLAVRKDMAQAAGLRFDARFDFHFYDMDWCRSARAAGLSLGTWPIDVVHQSGGAFSEGWHRGLAVYQAKWRD